jgi:hypothetical protein
MAKKITLEMLLQLKAEHRFTWTWKNQTELPPNRVRSFGRGKTKTEFYLNCGGCNTARWILWSELKKKRTSSCRTCAKAPSLEHMREIGKQVDSLYTPTTQWKMVNKRRYVFMQCKCGDKHWVSWNRFQQGYATGCKSCRSALRTHGRGHAPLQVAWKDLNRRHKDALVEEWKEFKAFEKWARAMWEPGWKLVRINRKKPYGPDNCDYMPINRKNPSARSELQLPVGNGFRAARSVTRKAVPGGLVVGINKTLP